MKTCATIATRVPMTTLAPIVAAAARNNRLDKNGTFRKSPFRKIAAIDHRKTKRKARKKRAAEKKFRNPLFVRFYFAPSDQNFSVVNRRKK